MMVCGAPLCKPRPSYAITAGFRSGIPPTPSRRRTGIGSPVAGRTAFANPSDRHVRSPRPARPPLLGSGAADPPRDVQGLLRRIAERASTTQAAREIAGTGAPPRARALHRRMRCDAPRASCHRRRLIADCGWTMLLPSFACRMRVGHPTLRHSDRRRRRSRSRRSSVTRSSRWSRPPDRKTPTR